MKLPYFTRRQRFAAQLVKDLDVYDSDPNPITAIARMYQRYGQHAVRLINGAKERPQE